MNALLALLYFVFAIWTVVLMVGIGRIWHHVYVMSKTLESIESHMTGQSTPARLATEE